MSDKTFHEIEYEAWSERASRYDALFASISTQAIADILDSLGTLTGKRQLDIACGTGHLVAAASRRGAISHGVDFAPAMVAVARKNYPTESFKVASADQLPFGDGSYAAVSCAFGLSHMVNPQAAVAEAFRVLEPGGKFAFTLWFGPQDGGELLSLVNTVLTMHAVNSFDLPRDWTQLRFADEQICAAMTRLAGFSAPVFKKLPLIWKTDSAGEVLALVDKLSVRTKLVIDSQPEDIRERIYASILTEAEARRVDGVISLDWPALLTVVQKPFKEV